MDKTLIDNHQTAARRGEIFRMEWADVEWGNSRIRLWTRKRKDGTFEYDWLPMTKKVRKSLRSWWESELNPKDVVGHLLWYFIHDAETRQLYKEVFRKVRAGKLIGPIPFRCDSPQERRFLKLVLTPLPDGQIEIISAVARTERRDPIKLLDKDMARLSDLLKICSMCKKILTIYNKWVEIEEGLQQLKPFEAGEVPRLSHGLCKHCYKCGIADLND